MLLEYCSRYYEMRPKPCKKYCGYCLTYFRALFGSESIRKHHKGVIKLNKILKKAKSKK
jgi:hypothetical protein